MKIKLNTIEEAVNDIKAGKLIIIVDSPDRENEGDLIMAAEKVTPESINFMAKHGRGLICVPMESDKLKKLNINSMVINNNERYKTDFTISVDAKHGITTGISAFDRAKTIKVLINNNTTEDDLIKPGHIFPLRAKKGGVLERAGHTEAAVDIAKSSGMFPAGVICEIMNDDGTMARLPELIEFSKKFNLKIISILDFIKYRTKKEKLVLKDAEAHLPTKYGTFNIIAYKNIIDNMVHIALVKGKINKEKPVLIRVHSECLTGDVFGSLRCDCRDQLHKAMRMIEEAGTGVIVYMRQEGRGIGIENKLKAYKLQEQGMDTVEANCALGFPADLRDYGIGAQILVDLGIKKIMLLTNNPKKIIGIQGYGLEIVKRIPIEIKPNKINKDYLLTKKIKLGHLLEHVKI